MCDFSYLKECVDDLKRILSSSGLSSSDKEEFRVTFTAIDSQIVSLQNYVENESRKKVEAEEKIQSLESELIAEKEARFRLENSGARLSDEQLKIINDNKLKAEIAEEAKNVARETLHLCLDLKRIWKSVQSKATEAQLKQIEDVWEKTKVSSIISPTLVVSLETTSTLRDAIELGSVVSAVYRPEDDSVAGIISFVDIIGYLDSQCGSDNLEEVLNELADEDMGITNEYAFLSVENIVANSCVPYWPVFHNGSISNLINVFNKGIGFIPICDPEDHMITNIVTPGFLVNVLSTNLSSIEPVLATKPSNIELLDLVEQTKDRVVTVKSDAIVLQAIDLMYMLKRNAVAVVDDKGKIISTLGLNNFKGMHCKDLPDLLLPVKDFIEKRQIMIPICVTEQHTLKQLTTTFIVHKPEYLWVVNKKEQPIGLIYLTDILNLLDIKWESVGWK